MPASLAHRQRMLKHLEATLTALRRGIPSGKTRVIGVDLFSHEDYLVKDCDTVDEAFEIADKTNKQRRGPMADVCYVYNDTGEYIRGQEAVYNLTDNLGVSP